MSIPTLHSRRSNPRRWFFTLMILLMAGGIFLWESQREKQRQEHVKIAAATLMMDVCAGRPTTTFTFTDALVWSQVIEAIKPMCAKSGIASVTATVTKGDVASAGSFQGTATHVVVIATADGKSVGLRVRCEDASAPVVLLGYFGR